MSQISLSYKSLELLAENSRRTSSAINTYISSIDSQTKRPCGSVTGPDDTSNVSSASSLAQSKMNELLDAKKRYDNFAKNVDDLAAFAKSKDKTVSDRIEELADKYVGPRKWYQKAGDWIYDTFCVDTRNMGVAGKLLSDLQQTIRWSTRSDLNVLRQIKDWFKYGDGKYVLEIGKAVVGAVVAVAGCIAAIAAIPFSGGATIPIVIGTIGAIATCVGTLITLVDTGYKIYGNGKALSKSGNIFKDGDADEGVARYYGSISKYSDYTKKRDFGGKAANKFVEFTGQAVDTVHSVADKVSAVCDILSLGNVRQYNHPPARAGKVNQYPISTKKYETGYSLSKENILKNLRVEIGMNTKGDKWLKNPLSLKNTIFKQDKISKYTITLKNGKVFKPAQKLVTLFNVCSSIDNINNIATAGDKIANITDLKSGYDAYKSVTKVASKFNVIKTVDKYTSKPITKVIDFRVNEYKEVKSFVDFVKAI